MTIDRMLRYFKDDDLPGELREASAPFRALAEAVVDTYPMSAERTVCLRKLLEAKDALLRTLVHNEEV